MAELKYIIMEATSRKGVVKVPFIFGHYASHKDMARDAGHMLRHGQFPLEGTTVASAGFIDLETMTTHGHSDSLDMGPAPGDADVIKNFRMDWSL